MRVPGHELYLQPLGRMSDAELLGAVKHNVKFTPSKRLYQQIIRRGLWKSALGYPLLITHCECFLEIVTGTPYHNQAELNHQCERIAAAGVTAYLQVKIAEAKEATGRTISIFERNPAIHVPVTIWVFPSKKRSAKG